MNDDARVVFSTCGILSRNCFKDCLCKECEPSVPFTRLLGHRGFYNFFSHDKDSANDNIQEIIYMGSGLMWNDANIRGGRMGL